MAMILKLVNSADDLDTPLQINAAFLRFVHKRPKNCTHMNFAPKNAGNARDA